MATRSTSRSGTCWRLTSQLDTYTKALEDQLKAMNMEVLDARFAEMAERMAEFGARIQETFNEVDRVETTFHGSVAQTFKDIASEIEGVRQQPPRFGWQDIRGGG